MFKTSTNFNINNNLKILIMQNNIYIDTVQCTIIEEVSGYIICILNTTK